MMISSFSMYLEAIEKEEVERSNQSIEKESPYAVIRKSMVNPQTSEKKESLVTELNRHSSNSK